MDAELEAIPIRMAEQVRELLPAVTVAQYQRYRELMRRFADGNAARLAWGAEPDPRASSPARHDDAVPAIADFDAAWRRWSAPGRIGARHVIASIAAHLAGDLDRTARRLGLTREPPVVLDEPTAAQLDVALATDRAATLAAARAAADFWVGLHFDAFV